MATFQDEEDFTTFEWELSEEMDRHKDYLISNVFDLLPLPEKLGVNKYLYIAFIWVPLSKRRQGTAKKLIAEFCENNSDSSVYVELCKNEKRNNPLNGLPLEGFLKSIGFEVTFRVEHRIGMFLKRI